LISDPGGPTWQINDWLAFSQSLEKVDSLWADDDYLYFDDLRDLWYYRITRQDLMRHNLTLKAFLQPIQDMLTTNADFQAIAKKEPEVSQRITRLKSEIGERVADPKRLSDFFN
jgi:glycosyltransferase involved in cell wall biosynthesis